MSSARYWLEQDIAAMSIKIESLEAVVAEQKATIIGLSETCAKFAWQDKDQSALIEE